jgi:hypothetical protein
MTRLLPASLLLVTLCAGCRTAEAPTPTDTGARPGLGATDGPRGSAFWRVPLEAPSAAQRGDVLQVQERTDAPEGSRGWNLIYVSEGATGALVYVSGEIYIPNAAAPDGGRPVVVWNHGTAGQQDSCAPSRNDLDEARVPALASLLQRGYVVAMSDYQGLGTPGGTEYLNGPTQGKAALDVARAARKLSLTAASDQVAMYGFSQGGQTSLWSAHLAPTYAPELNLRGVVAIAPAARHLDLSFYDLKIPANSGYFIARMAGLAVGHPEVKLTDMLTPAGLAALDAQIWDCYEIFAQAAKMSEPYAYPRALEPGTAWRKLLEANDAFLPIGAAIPIFVLQGDADVDVGVQLTRDVVRDLCAGGSIVQYQENAGVNHMDQERQAAPAMADWFAARFAGTAAPNTCAAQTAPVAESAR